MIKIAFPKNQIYEGLFAHSDDYCRANNIQYYKLTEAECADYLLRNLVDCAFLSPLGYGKGVMIADFRIVPGPMLFAINYTELASIFFREGAEKINIITSNSADDFIIIIARLILKEKFGIDADFKQINAEKEDLLRQGDSAIVWGKSQSNEISLDVSEEWFDLFEEPLPLGFWVVRAETFPPNIQQIVNGLAIPDLPSEVEITETLASGETRLPRKGQLIWRWREDLQDAISSVLIFLYYHQFLPEIPAVKILGFD